MSDACARAGVRSLVHHERASCCRASISIISVSSALTATSSIPSRSLLACVIPRSSSIISRVKSVSLQFMRMMASPGAGRLIVPPRKRRSSSILRNVCPSSAFLFVISMYFSIPFSSGSSISFGSSLARSTASAASSPSVSSLVASSSNRRSVSVTMATALANASCSLVPMRIELDNPISALSILASATFTPCARCADAHLRTNS